MGLFLSFLGAATFLIVARIYMDRAERGRRIARQRYENAAAPIFMRHAWALSPGWAVASLLFGLALLIPPADGRLVALLAVDLAGTAFFMAYQNPELLAPHWLRGEIQRGAAQIATPDRLDWLAFWIVLPIVVFGNISVLLLILMDAR
jgi:hypothetical protein